MARPRYHVGVSLTKYQTVMGWLYLPFFLVLTSLCIQLVAIAIGRALPSWVLQTLYTAVNFVFVVLVYGKFLGKSVKAFTKDFWLFIQTLILGFALYYILQLVLSPLVALILKTGTSNNANVLDMFHQNRVVMLLVTVVATPIVEEVLFRGVVFGTLHKHGRILAYAVSAVLFALSHVWQYFGQLTFLSVLAETLIYLVPPVALGWTYEKSGTIWCPIILHMLINAIAAGLLFI